MSGLEMTKRQAARFLLVKHGLLGKYRFSGKEGILKFVRQAGCIQFDPVDVCGRNADLVLQSRVKDYRKQDLYRLLYEEYALVDYFDKNLAIIPLEDWPLFGREREAHFARERSHEEIHAAEARVKEVIRERGPVCSADLGMDEKVAWYWSSTRLSRAVLEHLYFTGELGIHHKKGTIKYYDLIERCIPAEIVAKPDPFPDDHMYRKELVLRRIGSVGMLWNRASDAWLGIRGLKAAERSLIFEELATEGRILPVSVEGVRGPLYVGSGDAGLLAECVSGEAAGRGSQRCEFLAPLDNLLWDRKLVREIFGFDYKWELYTPVAERKYGYYVLPVLEGERFIGRIELASRQEPGVQGRTLVVKNFWPEDGVRMTKRRTEQLRRTLRRFARFAECTGKDFEMRCME